MAQSLSRLLVHVVFSTKGREPVLVDQMRADLHGYLATTARDKGWECYRVGGVADHVHLAMMQPRTDDLSTMVGHLKRTSTVWLQRQGDRTRDFHWQRGFGAFSISASHLDALLRYIDTQDAHHRTMSFQEEMRVLFERYKVAYDERYVWD